MAGKGLRRILNKTRAMDRQELAERSRQEFSKRLDTLLARVGYDFTRDFRPGQPSAPGKFFFQPDQAAGLAALLRERLPRQAERIVHHADKICSHRFDLLGYRDLDYGPTINWHLDLVHGKQAPHKPFHRVQYLDFSEVGDSKVTWELNRHQHLVTLAKAYRLTDNQRYADEIVAQWRDWHTANPYPIGINWASSLEVAFRSLSWHWVYFLLDGTSALDAQFRAEWLRAQALNGRHLQRYLSTYFSPNTHLLGEAVALYFLGTLCPELTQAEKRRELGWRIVLEETQRQVNPDGFYFEQSTYYHVYALDFLLHSVLLASANGQENSAELEQTIERMLTALFQLSIAGPAPRFGDDDGGRLFDPSRNRAEHLTDPLATGAILFGRADFKRVGGELREETIWLLGEAGVREWDRIQGEPVRPRSAALESSGLYILSAGSAQLAVRGGSKLRQSYGHDHADGLSICLQSAGRQLLIDPGTREYVGEGTDRNRFRGTAIHNTLRVDGQDQAEPAGPFSWKQHAHLRTEQWISGESFDLFVGTHDGYSRLASPLVHRRWVLALKSGIFLVRDLVEGEGEHRVEVSWHLAQDLQMQQEKVFRVKDSSHGLTLLPVEQHGWSEEVHKGPWSPAYGQQSTATVLNFGATQVLPAEFATLLVPFSEPIVTAGVFTRLASDPASRIQAYRYQSEGSDYRIFFARPNESWALRDVASDAEVVGISKASEGTDLDVFLCNGSFVEVEGLRLIAAKRSLVRCEVLEQEGTRKVYSSDPEAFEPHSTNVAGSGEPGT